MSTVVRPLPAVGVRQIVALLAIILFGVAWLCFHGEITTWAGDTVQAAGLFFLALAILF